MAKILIADDDPHIRDVLSFALEQAGHRTIERGRTGGGRCGARAGARPRRPGHHSTERGRGGTGLGLSIVRAIAEAHGGRAGARVEDRGATFFVTLVDSTAGAAQASPGAESA